MLSTTLRQSVATLGVVAGLLAAAGPASAQILDGPILAKAGPTKVAGESVRDDVPLETVSFTIMGAVFRGELVGLEPTVKAPASPTSEVFTSVSNVAPLHAMQRAFGSGTKPLGTASRTSR